MPQDSQYSSRFSVYSPVFKINDASASGWNLSPIRCEDLECFRLDRRKPESLLFIISDQKPHQTVAQVTDTIKKNDILTGN